MDTGPSVVGRGLSGADDIAERFRGPGEFVPFICEFEGVDMVALFGACR